MNAVKSAQQDLNMAANLSEKSNNQRRGGKRPGAGRKPKSGNLEGVVTALEALDAALLKNEEGKDPPWTAEQHRWHLAMVFWGISPDLIARAIFKPGVSAKFHESVLAAIRAVEVDARSAVRQ
jgi:hypothetical protein